MLITLGQLMGRLARELCARIVNEAQLNYLTRGLEETLAGT